MRLSKKDAERHEWSHALEAISLDCGNQYLDEADFPDLDRASLRAICRDFVHELYRHQTSAKELIAQAFRQIQTTLGVESEMDLIKWLRDGSDSHHEEDDEMRWWLPYFGSLAEFVPISRPVLPLNLPEDKLLLLKYHYLYCIGSIFRLRSSICTKEQQEFSEWDKFVSENYPEGTSCLTWISNEVHFRYNKLLWQKINATLSPDELQILLAWGIEQAALWKAEFIPSAKYLIK